MKFSDRCRPLKHAFLTCVCGVNSLLEIKEERIKVLEGALLELKHQSHHTIAEEMWRIDEALKPYQSKERA